jgi:cullin 3
MASSGLNAMIHLDKVDGLSCLYQLYSLVPEGVPSLRRSLKASIQKRGTELNEISMEGRGADDGGAEDELDPAAAKGKGKAKVRPPNAGVHSLAPALRWVEDVLQLKDKFDHVWELSFKNNREIESGLNEVIDIISLLLLMRLTYSRLSSRLLTCIRELLSSYHCILTRI